MPHVTMHSRFSDCSDQIVSRSRAYTASLPSHTAPTDTASHQMIPAFPRWIWLWAISLPFVAGAVNASALLALQHGGVTHLTGVSTEAALGMASADANLLGHAGLVIGLFTAGCAISAWCIRTERWRASHAAALMLLFEAMLLGAAAWSIDVYPARAAWLCALAIGLQNGTTSFVTGAVLRTSHLTGMFTDLGITLGQWLRGAAPDVRRAQVSVLVITCFIAGATAGAVLHAGHPRAGLLLPAALVIVNAAMTMYWCRRSSRPYA